MKLYFMKVGYFLIFIFAILNFLGLKQTEFEIRQLDSTARILTTHAEAVQAAQEQPTLNEAAASTLTRADTQIAIASFSTENVAGEAKRLASLCNANIKEKSITASVSNDAVLEEMARRPNMYGRLVIPSVGVNVALFAVFSQAEGQETEQEAVIEKLLADAVITDTAPATTVFGETVKDDVEIEANDGYLQLQLNDDIVLASTFNFNFDKNAFSKTLNLPGGLTVRYGNVQDKETGYIPFVSTVNNRNVKILSTGAEVLQKFF